MTVDIWPILSAILAGLAIFWVQRATSKADRLTEALEKRVGKLESDFHEMQLKMVSTLATKEDVKEVWRTLESMEATAKETLVMLLRLDERAKMHPGVNAG